MNIEDLNKFKVGVDLMHRLHSLLAEDKYIGKSDVSVLILAEVFVRFCLGNDVKKGHFIHLLKHMEELYVILKQEAINET